MASAKQRVLIETIEDDYGKTLLDAGNAALQEIEDAIQRHINTNDGKAPGEGKKFKGILEVEIEAPTEHLRDVRYSVKVKLPDLSLPCFMRAHSEDGVLVMDPPARQQGFNFQQVAEKASAGEQDAE